MSAFLFQHESFCDFSCMCEDEDCQAPLEPFSWSSLFSEVSSQSLIISLTDPLAISGVVHEKSLGHSLLSSEFSPTSTSSNASLAHLSLDAGPSMILFISTYVLLHLNHL